jgi:hypothetical protein
VARAQIEVVGGRRLRATLLELGIDVQDFKDIHEKVASFVGASAAGNAPRRSGMLGASWRPGSAKTQAVVRFGGSAVPYANAVHWGTGARPGKRGPHNIAPSLFATKAASDTEPTWVPWYMSELDRLVGKVRGE